jgi:hypothetical protein
VAIWFSDNSTYKYILMLDDLDVAFAQGISGDSVISTLLLYCAEASP